MKPLSLLLTLCCAAPAWGQLLTQRAVSAAPGAMSGVQSTIDPLELQRRLAEERAEMQRQYEADRAQIEEGFERIKTLPVDRPSARRMALEAMVEPADSPGFLNQEVLRKLPELYRNGNPFVTYSERHLQAWPEQVNFVRAYILWGATGKQSWLDTALAQMPPETYDYNRNQLRQYGLYWGACYAAAKPHLTKEADAEWRKRLTNLGREMLHSCRAGDFDESMAFYFAWMYYDQLLGTTFLQATKGVGEPGDTYYVGHDDPATIKRYLDECFSDKWINFTDASTAYYVNNASLICFAAACVGRENVPRFDEWLASLQKYLVWSVSADLQLAEGHGDVEGSGDTLLTYYRLPLMWMVISMGGDKDGQLLNLSRHFKPVLDDPWKLYPELSLRPECLFVIDPEILTKPIDRQPLPSGSYINHSSGTGIFRDQDSFAFASILPQFPDDHSTVGSLADMVLRYKGETILDRPGGYGINDNDYWHHNGVAFKGRNWFFGPEAQQSFDGFTSSGTGFEIKGHVSGPINNYDYLRNRWPGPNEYRDCRLDTAIKFDGAAFTVSHKWTSPGDTFPEGSEALPVVEQIIQSRYQPREVKGGWEWTMPSGHVVKAVGNADLLSMEPYERHKAQWYRMKFRSAPDKYVGAMAVTVAPAGVEKPEPEPEPDKPTLLKRYPGRDGWTYEAWTDQLRRTRKRTETVEVEDVEVLAP